MRCFFLLLYFYWCMGFSQTYFTNVDSLLSALPKAKNDTIKARLYIRIANGLSQSDPEKALKYSFIGLDLVKKMKWDKGLAAFYNDIGSVYLNQSKYVQALENFKQSINYSSNYPNLRAIAFSNISVVYYNQTDIPLALHYNNQALKIAEKENYQMIMADCFSNYGLIYAYQKDSIKAEQFFTKVYELCKANGDLERQASALTHLGEVSTKVENTIAYYLKSKTIWDSVNPSYVLAISNLLGLIDAKINLLMQDSNAIRTRLNNKAKALAEVERYIHEAIANSKVSKSQQNLMYAYGKMSELKELQGDYESAFKYINMNYEIYIKVFSQENSNKIAEIENRQKISAMDQEIYVRKLEITQNRRQQWFYAIGLILLAIIGLLLFYQNQQRKKANSHLQKMNADLDESNQTKNKLLSILNHDLKSPVSNIIDLLHLQKQSPELLDASTNERLSQSVLKGAEHLLHTMEDLLLWSKGQMEHFKPHFIEVNVLELFEDTKKYFSSIPYLYLDQIQIPFIYTDENYLKVIVRNVLSNAIKALEGKTDPRIIWSVWQDEQFSYLSIADNAVGMDASQANVLFDSNTDIGIKNGLGLHLIRDLAKVIDCEIIVDSILGQGTKITLKLPIQLAS